MSRRQPTKKDLDAAIHAAGKRGDINEVVRLWQILGPQSDAYTYSIVITAAGNNSRMDLAQQAFQIAIDPRNYQVDVVVLNSMISAAGKNNRMDLALQAFQIATHPRNYLASVVTFANMITAAGLNNNMYLAKRVLKIAIDNSQADEVTFLCMNAARQKNKLPPGTRFRHNPYSFVKNWERDNTGFRRGAHSSAARNSSP